jgi:hypothetical protein
MDSITKKRLDEVEKRVGSLPKPTGKYIPSHQRGICKKTGKRYSTYERFVDRTGPMSGYAGYEVFCDQCDGFLGLRDAEWS